MSEFHVDESQPVADLLTIAAARLGPGSPAGKAAASMRSAATPKNGFSGAFVLPVLRPQIAGILRLVAADSRTAADQLEVIAGQLDATSRSDQ